MSQGSDLYLLNENNLEQLGTASQTKEPPQKDKDVLDKQWCMKETKIRPVTYAQHKDES